MLGAARTASRDLEWLEGSAVVLPVEEGEAFDIAFCQHDRRRIAERRVGPIQDARQGFLDDAASGALLSHAGFEDVTVEPSSLTMRFGDGAVFVRHRASRCQLISISGCT
jgi:hypothetical protein